MSMTMAGDPGCPCIGPTQALLQATATTGGCVPIEYSGIGIKGGVLFDTVDPCFHESYGYSRCKPHDLNSTIWCGGDEKEAFCQKSWCYIDFEACRSSTQDFYPSELFDHLYWSYSTCNSSALEWQEFAAQSKLDPIKNADVMVTIPGSLYPFHYKRTTNGQLASFDGPEYFNDSIPFEGSIIEYMDGLVELSGANSFRYTFRSRRWDGSLQALSTSAFTQSVYEVQLKATDVAASVFSRTSERLRRVSFTIPLVNDPVILYVPRPEIDSSIVALAGTTLSPFSTPLWLLLGLSFVVIGILKVWFDVSEKYNDNAFIQWGSTRSGSSTKLKTAFSLAEGIWETFINFFNASTDVDFEDSLPHRQLQVGVSFLTLVTVAAYTANLAAYLGRTSIGFYYESIEDVTSNDARICIFDIYKEETVQIWPETLFMFYSDYGELFEAYDEGKCEAIALAEMQALSLDFVVEGLCERDLVASPQATVLRDAVALPVSSQMSSGMSVAIDRGTKQGLTFSKIEKRYRPTSSCDLELSDGTSKSELLKLGPQNFLLPFVVLIMSMIVAVITKLVFMHHKRQHSKLHKARSDRFNSIRQAGDTTCSATSDRDLTCSPATLDESSDPRTRPIPSIVQNTNVTPTQRGDFTIELEKEEWNEEDELKRLFQAQLALFRQSRMRRRRKPLGKDPSDRTSAQFG